MGTALPRGIRNNNPLNIRRSNASWQGKLQHPIPYDNDFEQFRSMAYGIRAAFACMRTHILRDSKYDHQTTLAEEINRWAPPSENNTRSYINFVCEKSGLPPEYVLKFNDCEAMCQIVRAMAIMECGNYPNLFTYELFQKAYNML